MGTSFVNKVFVEILQHAQYIPTEDIKAKEGIVKSVNEFLTLLIEANGIYNKTFNVPENKQLIFVEDFPKEALNKLNNISSSEEITDGTLKDIRVITYLTSEEPAIIGSHTINSDGVRNLKHRYNFVYPDPEHTGYSIARSIKDIQVNITFKVWGNYFQDIRERSKLLREVIETNVWYFKHKGLREIVWVGSFEEETWDAKNIAKFKTEKYQLKIAEVKEFKQKDLEQIVIQIGLDE
jgi:hypothetical protein